VTVSRFLADTPVPRQPMNANGPEPRQGRSVSIDPDADASRARDASLRNELLKFGALLTGSRPDAEDLVQTALTLYYDALARGTTVDLPNAYVRRVMVTEVGRRRRRAHAWRVRMPLLRGEQATTGPASGVADRDRTQRALARLPHRQRLAVVLRFYADLPYSDIATDMGIQPSAARTLVTRGLANLRINYEGDSSDD
jgi:RNA polymerase sigma factor (sigma-70 family)